MLLTDIVLIVLVVKMNTDFSLLYYQKLIPPTLVMTPCEKPFGNLGSPQLAIKLPWESYRNVWGLLWSSYVKACCKTVPQLRKRAALGKCHPLVGLPLGTGHGVILPGAFPGSKKNSEAEEYRNVTLRERVL